MIYSFANIVSDYAQQNLWIGQRSCYYSNVMNTKETGKNGNQNGTRDYSHLPRARDFKLPKKLSPELKAAMKATREAMEALQREEEKYGKKPNI